MIRWKSAEIFLILAAAWSGTSACGSYPFCTNCIRAHIRENMQKKQARKLQDAQAEKLTSLQANKLTS